MNKTQPTKSNLQLIWGAALVVVGIAVFFRIPQVMPQLAQMGQSATTIGFIRICFYLMGILLVGGGTKKIIQHFRQQESRPEAAPADEDE